MRHAAIRSLAAAITAALPIAAHAQPNTVDPTQASLRERCASAAVLIETFDADNKLIGPAAGFLIEPNLLITDRHCIEGVSRAALNLGPDGELPVTGIIADGHDLDIVILTVPKLPSAIHPLHWAAKPAVTGDTVYLLIRDGDGKLSIKRGAVHSCDRGFDGPIVYTTIRAYASCSGSPIVDSNGEVAIAVDALAGMDTLRTTAAGASASAVQTLPVLKPQSLADWWTPQETPGGPAARKAIREGQSLEESRDSRSAAERFRAAVNSDPTSDRAWCCLAYELQTLGREKDSLDAARQWADKCPKSFQAQLFLGTLLHRQGDDLAAAAAFQTANDLYPLATTLISLAAVHESMGDIKRSASAWKKATELDPTNETAFARLGFALASLDDNTGAEEAFARAARLNPDGPSLYTYVSSMFLAAGKADQAAAVVRKYLANGGDKVSANRRIAAIEYHRSHFQDAIAAYSAVLEAKPDDPEAIYWLADSYLRAGDKEKARPLIDRLTKLSPYRANRLRLQLDAEPSK